VLFRVSLLLCGTSLLLLLALIAWHLYDKSQVVGNAKEIAAERARNAARQIDATLSKVPIIALTFADEVASGELMDHQVEDRLIRELELNPELGAVTACYSPEFVPDAAPHPNLYCPYCYTDSEKRLYIERVEDSYDYTMPHGSLGPGGNPIRTAWYNLPLTQGPVWGEPYLGSGGEVSWPGFGTPFYQADPTTQEQVIAGIIDVSLTLDGFQELVGSVDLGRFDADYGFLISESEVFISHPIDEFVKDQRNISSFEHISSVEHLRLLARSQDNSGIVVLDHQDVQSGRASWLFLTPVASAGWWVGIELDRDSITQAGGVAEIHHRMKIGIAMVALLFLFSISVLVVHAYRGSIGSLWAMSGAFSLLCILGIAYLWYLNVTSSPGEHVRDIKLVNSAIAEKVAADYGRGISDPIYVPTGVFIQKMDFTSANDVLINGYIWQKYSDDIPEWARPDPGAALPGFVLPQADLKYLEDVVEAYRRKEGDQEIIGWRFRAELRQKYDYSHYPFHRQDVLMRIWYKDFDRGVILVPDLAAYETTSPKSLPGIEQEDFVLEGWNTDTSFFSYRENRYNTNFGLQDYIGQGRLPELYFHIGLTRQFIDAFIGHIIPLAVVASLLFAVLMTITLREQRVGLFGFSASAILTYCAALFFVVVLSHISLRSGLEAPERIVYLEYFYFIIYGTILAMSANAILFTSSVNIGVIQWRDNLLVELLFWPVMLGMLLGVTLLTFA
jgi:hypothetical protein